jgi:hypothetical protein
VGKNLIGATALLLLVACGHRDGKGKAAVSITTDDKGATTSTTTTTSSSGGSERVNVTSDAGNGRVKIEAPGFKLDVDVPRSIMNAGDFEIDGAKLYPGSRMRGMDVRAGERENDAHVKFGFVAPADPATVRGWMVKEFAAKGHPLVGEGMTMTGTTEDGKPFTVALNPGDSGQTRGEIMIEDEHKGADWSSR